MLIRLKIPKTIMWVINLLVIFLLIFTLFRFATYFSFKPKDLSFKELIPSFLLGVRYDLRWIAIILLPIVFVSLIPNLSPFILQEIRNGGPGTLPSSHSLFFSFSQPTLEILHTTEQD